MTQIRGAFPLPQTSPQICGVPSVVTLAPGGIYVFPSGNYLVQCGPNTILQWFDPLALMWRVVMPSQDYTDLNADGANYRLVNITGVVESATITAPGASGVDGIGPVQTGTSISFDPPPAGGVTGQATGYLIIGGALAAPTVVQGGEKFAVAPVVCCDPPPIGGIQATFTCTVDATGMITAVTVVNPGAGYVSVPQFYIVPQPRHYQGAPQWPMRHEVPPPWDARGLHHHEPWPAPGLIHPQNVWPGSDFQPNIDSVRGALIVGTPLTGTGTVTGIVVNYYGAGYTAAPAITFAGGPLTGAAATAELFMLPGQTTAPAPAPDTSYIQASVN
ncbi:MAG: hypothetical protein J2P16_00620 [Mycobacterium sp.]|nr:hypothetical protein [Mycobacterium sp.]